MERARKRDRPVKQMKSWNIQLVSPNGKVFEMGSMGFASSTQEHGYIMPEICRLLENSTYTQKEFILAAPYQTLLNSSFYQFHGYRLAWGEANPEDAHVAYPNGKDVKWTLYRLINGKTVVYLQGSLPEDWWDLDEYDRQALVEQKVQEFEYA